MLNTLLLTMDSMRDSDFETLYHWLLAIAWVFQLLYLGAVFYLTQGSSTRKTTRHYLFLIWGPLFVLFALYWPLDAVVFLFPIQTLGLLLPFLITSFLLPAIRRNHSKPDQHS